MGPSIDFNSYNNGMMNDNILNQLMQTKANRFGPAVQQANAGLDQGISNFNNDNMLARMFGFGGGQGGGGGGGQGGGMSIPGLGGMMGGGSAGGAAGASGAANGAWSYLGMMG
jgi:hypothetical protein